MDEFRSFYKEVTDRKANTWCRWTTRLDTYGCGCGHNCDYCYARSLLDFRGLWHPDRPSIADLKKIRNRISNLKIGSIVRMGGMTDCFQPCEAEQYVTYDTIKMLNDYGIGYLIVTKSDMITKPAYLREMDKDLAHIQITITSTKDITYERAPSFERRKAAIEELQAEGFDVSIRLSPYLPEYADTDKVNDIKCDKILAEFLKVNPYIKTKFNINYSEYTLKCGGYTHLPLDKKISLVNRLTNFKEISVGEYVNEHYEYFRDNVNANPDDCCNLRLPSSQSGAKWETMSILDYI